MPGGGKLTIETANRWLNERVARVRDLPPGQYVSLCVSHNGAGMPLVPGAVYNYRFRTEPGAIRRQSYAYARAGAAAPPIRGDSLLPCSRFRTSCASAAIGM